MQFGHTLWNRILLSQSIVKAEVPEPARFGKRKAQPTACNATSVSKNEYDVIRKLLI